MAGHRPSPKLGPMAATRRRWALGVVLACAFTLPQAASAVEPAVARPHFVSGTEPRAGGSAFFVAAPGEAGAVAVTTAHAFSLADLALAHEVRFELAAAKERVSVASRLHAEPGKPFSAKGGTLRDDFLVFALDLAPRGVRTLPLCQSDCAKVGQRVRVLGAPASGAADEDDYFGRITKAADDELEVELDVPADLRGFGGGPVLRQPGGDVIGILQAQWPDNDGLRLGVAPIDGVRAALARPLDGGLGRPFAGFAARAGLTAGAAAGGKAEAAARAAAANEPAAEGLLDEAGSQGPLLGRAGALSTDLRLAIDHPAEGGVVTDAEGAFVAGRALALLGEFRRFDVMLVIDTSDSTRSASGADVNENGVLGEDRLLGVFPITDAGDSILAAEVAAARRVLDSFDARSTRVGLATFAGSPLQPPATITIGGGSSGLPALTEQALTTEYSLVEKALDRVLARGPEGLTNMTEGVRIAVRELKGFRGAISKPDPESEKVVLFFTDGQPTLPYDNSPPQNIRSVLRAADQARRAGVVIHSFALGPEALDGPLAAVEMARASRGRFTPVRRPGDLVRVIENVNFANLDLLEVRNRTLERPATELVQKADGGFGALVPVQPGRNVIHVRARASDGTEAEAEVAIQFLPEASPAGTPAALVSLRNQLLEQRIVSLRRDRIAAERERQEEVRRELELEIERERTAAEARAATQRRELRIEPAPEDDAESEPEAGAPPAAP
jgi:hypothetical protein